MRPPPKVRRVLVTRLRFLGDVILTTPMLAALREALPAASIEYLTEPAFAPVLEQDPHVDRVHVLRRSGGLLELLRVARELRRPRVDWWFDTFGNPRSALIALLSAPRQSVGPRRGFRSRVFTHRRGRPEGDRSAVRHHLDKLVPLLGERQSARPRLHVAAEEIEGIEARLDLASSGKGTILHPGSTWPDKAWPEDRWAPLADGLLRSGRGPVWVLRPPEDPALADRVVAGAAEGVSALPALGLREIFALFAHCGLYIGNDGGILHAAVALGIPCVGLFGPTEPDIWFPYETWGPYRVLREFNPAGPCASCGVEHVSRLAHLSIERVLEAARALAAGAGQEGVDG